MLAGKHVFVEKPLAIDEAGLAQVIEAHLAAPQCQLLVGFNRRFSPLAVTLAERMRGEPLVMTYRVNAGPIPATHWTQDPRTGGGRIVGEVCHFIDLMQFLTGSAPIEVCAGAAGGVALPGDPDNVLIQIRFGDGSGGSIAYVSTGDASYAKERVEVFGGGKDGVIDNWRALDIARTGASQASGSCCRRPRATLRSLRPSSSPSAAACQRLHSTPGRHHVATLPFNKHCAPAALRGCARTGTGVNTAQPRCVVCGSQQARRLRVALTYGGIRECPGCGSGLLEPRPTAADLSSLHGGDDYFNHPYFSPVGR